MSAHPLVTELLGRIDDHLKTFPTLGGRRLFITGQIAQATNRYATARRCAARNERDPNVPEGMSEPSAADHLLFISELHKRLDELAGEVAA